MANVRLDWNVIQLGDVEGDFTTLQDLYAVRDRDEVLERMRKIVDGIATPKRTVLDKVRNDERIPEIQAVHERIKDLCAPNGSHFAKPVTEQHPEDPKQHILRAKDPEKNIVVVRDTTFYPENREISGYSPGFPENKKEEDEKIRYNFYWALTDLVGLFLTKLGPAPQWAQQKNFYLPLTAVYARWVRCLISKDFKEPSKYQCTWIRPALDTNGGFDEFSLGASFGGIQRVKNVGSLGGDQTKPPETFWTNLQRARWELLGKDKTLKSAKWEVRKQNTKEGQAPQKGTWSFDSDAPNGIWKFGNCAETHPLIVQHLIDTEQKRKDRTHGFAFDSRAAELGKNNEWLDYNEDRMLKIIGGGRHYRHIVAPCENCTFMINHYEANVAHFTPISVFPLPRVSRNQVLDK